MEEIVVSIIEKSLIGGAFLYMLYYFLGRFGNALESVSKTLESISSTLLRTNFRLDAIEERIKKLEGGDICGQSKCD